MTSIPHMGVTLDFVYHGCAPTHSGYFERVAARNSEEQRIRVLVRMKAILTLCDVMDALEAA